MSEQEEGDPMEDLLVCLGQEEAKVREFVGLPPTQQLVMLTSPGAII